MKKIFLFISVFLFSNICLGYNGNPSRTLVHARYVHGATTNTLSAMTLGYIDAGVAYLSGSGPASYTAFVAPQNGTYVFQYTGWQCGVGTNDQEVIDTRSGSIVYDQRKGFATGDCGSGAESLWTVYNVLSGDVFTFKLNENNTGTPITSLTDNTEQSQGDFTASILQNYP